MGRLEWPRPCHTIRYADPHWVVRIVEVKTGELRQSVELADNHRFLPIYRYCSNNEGR